MTQADRAADPGHLTIEMPGAPGVLAAVGATLVCPGCGISGVVRARPAFPGDALTCHGYIEAGRPVPCDEIRPRQLDDIMVAGRLYVDAVSGFAFWCTRGGSHQVKLGERLLGTRITAGAF